MPARSGPIRFARARGTRCAPSSNTPGRAAGRAVGPPSSSLVEVLDANGTQWKRPAR